jgi:hypothetical protein
MTGIPIREIEKMSKEGKEDVGIKYILGLEQEDGKECRDLAWAFFLDYHNSISAFALVKPEEYKKNYRSHIIRIIKDQTKRKKAYNKRKKLNDNTINKCYKLWKRTDFFIGRSEQGLGKKNKLKSPKLRYTFNLLPFFRYAASKGVNFSYEQERILEIIFEPKKVKEQIYEEYSDLNFLEAMLKYYVGFYIYFLKHSSERGKEHYLNKEFLDFLIFPRENSRKRKGMKLIGMSPSKEEKMLELNSKRFQYYLDPDKPLIFNLRPADKRGRNPKINFNFKGNYYSVYHSLHVFYKEIMDDLDDKVMWVVLHGNFQKNKQT